MKRPFPRIAFVLVVLAGLASPAIAQKPATAPAPKAAAPAAPAAAPISPAHKAAVQELFSAMKLKTELQRLPDAMINSEVGRNPGLAPFRDVMVNWLKKYLTWDAMEPQLINLYAETYSEAELKELAAFYKTPTGQKAMAKMPELTQRSAMLGAQLGQAHSEELKKLMDARQQQLAKQQEKAAPGAGPKAGAGPPPAKQPTKKP